MYQLNAEHENSSFQVLGRLVMMGIFSALLCFSVFMTVFTPYPLGLSSVLYGRAKGAAVAFIGLITCYFSLKVWGQDLTIFFFFILSVGISFALSEVVRREINPIKGIIAVGITLTVLVSGLVYVGSLSTELTLKERLSIEFEKIQPMLEEQRKKVEASGESQPFEVEALLAQPDLMAQTVIENAPSIFLVGLFIMLWANLFLLLKSNRLVNKMNDCKYSETYLLNFKMPDQTIWFVIVSLALAIWGGELGPWFSIIGMTSLKTLGVFYFFQGFGIYLAFLDFLKLTGFFRSLMVVITVLTAGQVLAVVGLADMFVDFKKLMTKKED
jgi:hypothetical protein